jgi:hypothetical protein
MWSVRAKLGYTGAPGLKCIFSGGLTISIERSKFIRAQQWFPVHGWWDILIWWSRSGAKCRTSRFRNWVETTMALIMVLWTQYIDYSKGLGTSSVILLIPLLRWCFSKLGNVCETPSTETAVTPEEIRMCGLLDCQEAVFHLFAGLYKMTRNHVAIQVQCTCVCTTGQAFKIGSNCSFAKSTAFRR